MSAAGTDVAATFQVRREAGRSLKGEAPAVARACHDMAVRFRGGGTLLAFGNGGPSTDAQHVSVEFVHPVIVGKKALPALSLATDAATVLGVAQHAGLDDVFAHQVAVQARPADIALGISSDGEDESVLRGLIRAREKGLLTVALVGGDGGRIAAAGVADHLIRVDARDPQVVKEIHVTGYHLLWELVHTFLEHPHLAGSAELPLADGSTGDRAGPPVPTREDTDLGGLYPFLYDGAASLEGLVAEVTRSSEEKTEEIVALRDEVGRRESDALVACADDLAAAFRAGGRLLTCGNGGSSSDAQEVARSFLDPAGAAHRPLPALCLTNDVAVVTALSNDVDFGVVFARQVRAFGRPGDVLVGLSTSGNSPNVLTAFDAAKQLGMLTVGLAGSDGGAMAQSEHLDHLFVVPSSSVHRIQEVQTTLYHVLLDLTQERLTAP